MLRLGKITIAAIVATVLMAIGASAASAATGTVTGPGSLTASSSNLTLTVTSLATVTGTTNLTITLTPGVYTSTGALVQVGSITGAAITVGSPANTTVTAQNLPWGIYWKGELTAGGELRLYALGVGLTVRSGIVSKTGGSTAGLADQFAFTLNAAGTTDTVLTSPSLGFSGGSTGTLAGSLTNSSAVVWNL